MDHWESVMEEAAAAIGKVSPAVALTPRAAKAKVRAEYTAERQRIRTVEEYRRMMAKRDEARKRNRMVKRAAAKKRQAEEAKERRRVRRIELKAIRKAEKENDTMLYRRIIAEARRPIEEVKYVQYRSGAEKRGHAFDLTMDEFMALWGQPCTYCGAEIETIGVDRIDSAIGYIPANITPCCTFCNLAKRTLSVKDFIERCTAVAVHNITS